LLDEESGSSSRDIKPILGLKATQLSSKKPVIGTTQSTRRNRIAYEDDDDDDVVDEDAGKVSHKKSRQNCSDDENEGVKASAPFSIFKKVANKKKF